MGLPARLELVEVKAAVIRYLVCYAGYGVEGDVLGAPSHFWREYRALESHFRREYVLLSSCPLVLLS